MKHLVLILFLLSSVLMFSQKKKKHGPFEDSYKSGELKISGQHREGKKVGLWKEYYKSGALLETYTFTNKGQPTGFQESYFENGNPRSKTIQLKNKDFFRKGFYESGGLMYEMVLIDNPKKNYLIKNGLYNEYYKNQKPKITANYKNNLLVGIWSRYYDSGEKEWDVDYYSDFKQGSYKKYFKNGKLELEGTTALGFKNGIEKCFNEDGVVVSEGAYEKGVLDGEWTVLDDTDNKQIIKFKKGKRKKSKSDIQIKNIQIPDGTFEQVPVYPGCEVFPSNLAKRKCMSKKIAEFVNKNFNTGIAKELGLKGRQRINIIFKIDKEGLVTDIRARAPHKGLEEEAISVIKRMPKMKPGIQLGKAVNVPYSLPIIFVVPEKTKKVNDPFKSPFK